MTVRCRAMLLTSALALVAATVPATAATSATAATPPPDYVPANERVAKVASQYWGEHPNDFVGLGRTIRAHGGQHLSFMVSGHGRVSAQEAQRLYDQEQRAQQRARDNEVLDVPPDSFNVTGSWYYVQDQYGEWWNATGRWNFRDDYINGSDPGDISGIAATVPQCWANDGSFISAYDYQNNVYGGPLIRQNSPINASVYDVDDRTSGFAMLTDHGSHTLSFTRIGPGCAGQPFQARYYYEHNQGGSGGWSFGISIAGLSVSYTAPAPPSLQKATQVFRS